jgi:hypothetical protein
VENCQLGVFCAYAAGKGRALIGRELYLPKSWLADRDRCREAAVPEDAVFATKTDLARTMLGHALDAGIPAGWVTADEACGKDCKFRAWLEQRRIGYVVAVASNQAIPGSAGTSRAGALAAHAPQQAWNAAAAARAPRAPGCSTGRSPACPAPRTPRTPPRPDGPGGCWSAARSPATPRASTSWPITCAARPPEPPMRT